MVPDDDNAIKNSDHRIVAMSRKGFHILLALVLVGCALCPYIELAVGCNQSIFDTGYDTESTIAVIALILILAYALASLLLRLPTRTASEERLVAAIARLRPALDFLSTVPEASPPPLSLRI